MPYLFQPCRAIITALRVKADTAWYTSVYICITLTVRVREFLLT
jgi:hypothetical protein